MKKIKMFLICFFIVLIMVIPVKEVKAYSMELDPNSYISFPSTIWNNAGSLSIYYSDGDYELYYQGVEISDTVYLQMETLKNEGEKELESINKEIDILKEECESLEETYKSAYKTYNDALSDNTLTEEALKELETECEKINEDYKSKISEYNEKVSEYNTLRNEVNTKLAGLTPNYVEENWIKTEDKTFEIDTSAFSGKKAFVVWVKLVLADGTTIYDEAIYTFSGTKQEEENVIDSSQSNTPSSNTDESDDTVISGILPKTGKGIIMKASVLTMIGITFLYYKKYHIYKDIK